MCMITLEANYVHYMKMTASLTSLSVSGMEMMGIYGFAVVHILFCQYFFTK